MQHSLVRPRSPRPLFRQTQPSIDERLTKAARIGHENADLAVLDTTRRAGILACHTTLSETLALRLCPPRTYMRFRLFGRCPRLIDSRPFWSSACEKPTRVSATSGEPEAAACSVSPEYQLLLDYSPMSVRTRPASSPRISRRSPTWKLLIVSQILAVALRSSAKKVSAPLPPVMKLDPVPPSSTLVPLVTAIASSPLPVWMNQLGRWRRRPGCLS